MWEVWEERYGQRYYHFIYKNVLFLVLDTEDKPVDFQQHIHEARLEAISILKNEGRDEFNVSEYGQLEESQSGGIGAQQAAYF